MNSTTYTSIQYTNAQNTVLCFLAEKKKGRVMPVEAKWAQLLGSKYSILANSGFHENDRRGAT